MIEQLQGPVNTLIVNSFRASMEKWQPPPELPLSPAQKQAIIDGLSDRLSKIWQSKLNWDTFKPGIVQIYENTYTLEELTAIVDFIRTPAGKSYFGKSTAVAAQGQRFGQQLAQDTMAEFQKSIPSMIQEILSANRAPKN